MEKQLILMAMVVLLCFLLMPQHSYAAAHQGYLRANYPLLGNRKVVNVGGMEMKKNKYEEGELSRELREAPMGPDPLHHNGAPPRKPRTTTTP